MKRIGVLLAAGRSTRMGRPKQLLPWPPNSPASKPLVAAAFDAIARVCDEMYVVLGHEGGAVFDALGERTFQYFDTGNGRDEMIGSVRCGLGFAKLRDPSITQFLLHPADHPEVRLDTLERLIARADEVPNCAVMPQYRGQGGHPVLIPASVAELIVEYHGPGGLRQFWLDRPDLCVRLPVDDPGVVLDIDTQLDYDLGVQ